MLGEDRTLQWLEAAEDVCFIRIFLAIKSPWNRVGLTSQFFRKFWNPFVRSSDNFSVFCFKHIKCWLIPRHLKVTQKSHKNLANKSNHHRKLSIIPDWFEFFLYFFHFPLVFFLNNGSQGTVPAHSTEPCIQVFICIRNTPWNNLRSFKPCSTWRGWPSQKNCWLNHREVDSGKRFGMRAP